MRIRTLFMAVAMMAALLVAPMASSKAASPVFAGTHHTVLDKSGMQKVTAQGSTSMNYGYYGILYSYYAYAYGYIGYSYYDCSSCSSYYGALYYYVASQYAGLAQQNFYNAAYYAY